MLDRLVAFLRKQAVLCIAAACALASMAFVPPSAAYASYIDLRVIVLLFCLMASVAGLQEHGLFARMARRLLVGDKPQWSLSATLVLLPFFASMLVTNDVALIAFVPFAVTVLTLAGKTRSLAWVIVLQTIGANLGGMITPVGNPQNLYLYTYFDIPTVEFFAALAPFALLTLVLLCLLSFRGGSQRISVVLPVDESAISRPKLALHGILFGLCLLAVFRILPYGVLLGIVTASLLVGDRAVFRRVDYGLLATFAFFFIFAGNIGHIEELRSCLESMMNAHPFLTSVAASQVISNVPAAVLLSGFTDNWHSLLLGVDLGGLGTPIASLASLISLRIFAHVDGASTGSFLKTFAVLNIAFFALMAALYSVLFVL